MGGFWRGFWRDVVYGFRGLLRRPGFTMATLASLSLGIGTTTAIFTLYQSVFVNPLPLDGLDRLVKVARSIRNDTGEYVGEQPLAYPNYLDYVERSHSFDGIALYQWWSMYLTSGNGSERVSGAFVSGNYFGLLGLTAAEGRLLQPSDTEKSSPPVAVLSHGARLRLFGANKAAVGEPLQVNGESVTVVGVAPRGFRGIDMQANVDVFVPITMFERVSPYGSLFESRDYGIFPGIGRLGEGVTVAQASDEMMALARQLAGEHPESLDELGGLAIPLASSTIRAQDRDRYQGYATRLFLVVLILVIACLSVANLLFVRGAQRAREMALRQALGAGRGRLLRQLVTENLLLFLLGGLGGLAMTKVALKVLWSFRPPEVPAVALDLRLGAPVWIFALLCALGVGLVFGLLPAIRAARTDLVPSLKESEPFAGQRGLPHFLRPRGIVVALQVALALVALIGAGLLLRSLQQTFEIDLGFRSEQLAVISVAPGEQGYEEERARNFYRDLLERAKALPGVTAAGYSQNRLLRGAPVQRQVYLPGNEKASQFGARHFHRANTVDPGFFETAGIRIFLGDNFRDSQPGPPVVIVNQTMAEHLWGDQDPIRQRFSFDYPEGNPAAQVVEVVGVARNARYREVREEDQFFIYLPLAQNFASSMTLHVATAGDPATILPALRKVAHELDPDLALSDAGTLRHFVEEALWLERGATWLLGLFGALALGLALVGVYGLLAYTVSTRRRELGILIALGARRGHVVRSVLAETLQVVALGVVLGLALATWILRPFLENQLYNVGAIDPKVYAICPLVLLLAALGGSLLPAWRAARTNPTETLRAE